VGECCSLHSLVSHRLASNSRRAVRTTATLCLAYRDAAGAVAKAVNQERRADAVAPASSGEPPRGARRAPGRRPPGTLPTPPALTGRRPLTSNGPPLALPALRAVCLAAVRRAVRVAPAAASRASEQSPGSVAARRGPGGFGGCCCCSSSEEEEGEGAVAGEAPRMKRDLRVCVSASHTPLERVGGWECVERVRAGYGEEKANVKKADYARTAPQPGAAQQKTTPPPCCLSSLLFTGPQTPPPRASASSSRPPRAPCHHRSTPPTAP